MKHLKIFSIAMLIFSGSVYSQIQVTNFYSPAHITPCDTGTFKLKVYKTSGKFVGNDSVKISISLPPGIFYSGIASVNQPVQLNVNSINPTNPIFLLKGLAGKDTLMLTYAIKAGCSLININSGDTMRNTATYYFNSATALGNLNSNSYTVISPFLFFSSALSQNLQYSDASIDVPFERKFIFRNTAPGIFKGQIYFTDSVEFDKSISAIRILSISTTLSSGTVISTSVTDSSVSALRANINGLVLGDSIVIKETVKLVRCVDGINLSSALMNFHYGCNDTSLCKITPETSYQSWVLINKKPLLKFDEMDSTGGNGVIHYLCPAINETRIFRVINTGNAKADSVHFEIDADGGNNISYLDSSSVRVYKINGSTKNYFPVVVKTFISLTANYIPPSPSIPFKYIFSVADSLAPGDSIFLSYVEKKICLDTAIAPFNEPIFMNAIKVKAGLGHPCYPTGLQILSFARGFHNNPAQVFSLKQNFENYTAAMADNEEAWFKIDNQEPLKINVSHPDFPEEIILEPSKIKFQVELNILMGLGIITDSIYLFSNFNGQDSIWYPDNIQYFLNGNPANGSKIIATFSFPSYFFTSNNIPNNIFYNYGALYRKTLSFNNFFNRFSVRFKLFSDCGYNPPGGISGVEEKTFFIYDTTCSSLCPIPLSRVQSDIKLHCPGCLLPGWNMSSGIWERENFGWLDNNNDNHPDTLPLFTADKNYAQIRRAMIGDTLRLDISGSTSDGPVLGFSNIGFAFRYARFVIKSRLVKDLKFLRASGNYFSYITSSTDTFNLTNTTGSYSADSSEFYISLQGIFPDSMVLHDFINFHARFVLMRNIHDGGKYFNLTDIASFIYMSGTDFSNPLKKYAGPTPDSILSLTSAERAEYYYWCTGGDGVVTALGDTFAYFNHVEEYDGFHGVTQKDYCRKKIMATAMHSVGGPITAENNFHDESDQTALNSFAYEVRDFIFMDSLKATIPSDWEVDRIDIRISNLRDSSNATRYISSPEWRYQPFLYPLDSMRTATEDSSVTIFPSLFYQYLTQGFIVNKDSFYHTLDRGDETKRIFVSFILRMKDCHQRRDPIDMANRYPVTAYISKFPEKFGDTVIIKKNMPPGSIISRPHPHMRTQIIKLDSNINNANLSWQVNIVTDSSGMMPNDETVTTMENTFMYLVSSSGKIVIDTVFHSGYKIENKDSINGLPLYGIGQVRVNTPVSMNVNAHYNCVAGESTDTLLVITGWNCYGYPAAIGEACFADTTLAIINPPPAGLVGILSMPNTSNFCDTVSASLTLYATGGGRIENVTVQLLNQRDSSFQYISGDTVFFRGVAYSLEPSTDSLWHLNSISAVAGDFQSDSLKINFRVRICKCGNQNLTLRINAENYCGKAIAFDLRNNILMTGCIPDFDLWIKDNAPDVGDEPDQFASEGVHLSPDIWNRNANDTGLIMQEAIYAQTNYIKVIVRNRGNHASVGGKLKLYWSASATFGIWDDDWVNNIGSLFRLYGDVINPVGENIPSIPSNSYIIMSIPWTNVPDPQTFGDWEVHACVLARIETDDSINNFGMTYPEVSNTTDNTINNNNIAWKNVDVVKLFTAAPVPVITGNPLRDKSAKFNLKFSIPQNEMTNSFLQKGLVTFDLGKVLYDKWVKGGKKGNGIQEGKFSHMSPTGILHHHSPNHFPNAPSPYNIIITGNAAEIDNIEFGPIEKQFIRARFNYFNTTSGTEYNYDIIQTWADDKLLGGVRFNVHPPDCPQASAGNDTSIMLGTSIILNAYPVIEGASYTWYNNDNGNYVGSDSSMIISPNQTSTYELQIATPSGCLSYAVKTVSVIAHSTNLSVGELGIVSINPNPGNNSVIINYTLPQNCKKAQLDFLGSNNLSQPKTFQLNVNNSQITINTSNWQVGAYTLKLSADNKLLNSKNLAIVR